MRASHIDNHPQAIFADGVLEVSVPLPALPETEVRKVEIQDAAKAATTAA